MRTPAAALRDILIGNGAVKALVSQRIYVRRVAQDAAYPCVLLLPITGRAEEDLLTVGGQNTYRVTVEARSESSLQADELGGVICAALDNFTGTVSGVTIDRIRRASEAFLDDEPSKTFRRAIDFHVYYA